MSKLRTTSSFMIPRFACSGLAFFLMTAGSACRDDDAAVSGTGTDGAGDGSSTSGSEPGGTTTDAEPEGEAFVPGPGGMRRLSGREYRASVKLMLGSEAAEAAEPPEDTAQQGYDAVGGALLSVPSEVIPRYERSSAGIADAVLLHPQTLQTLVPCVAEDADASCYREVATRLGRFAFRRSLLDAEVDSIATIGSEAKDWGDGDFMTGLRYALMAILQSPSFLYLQEVGEDDAESGYRRLSSTELASRLSFFLTGHTPSLELLALAETGGLETEDQIREIAEELVAGPEARIALDSFFSEALRLRELSSAAKNADVFPAFSPELAQFMEDETLLLLYDIIWQQDADYRELFRAPYTFVNDVLAENYGIPKPGTGETFAQVEWPEEQRRAGFLSQGSFLTVQSSAIRNSPTKRGAFVQEHVLCVEIDDPNPDIELDLPDAEDLTLKELLEMHLDQDGCRSCHGLTDPVGFAFERYTAIGGIRTTDAGKPVETDGAVLGLGEWQDARELGEILADNDRIAGCLIENMMRGVLGRGPAVGEEPAVENLTDRFIDSGHSVQTLLVEMATHPLFRLVDEPK